MITALKLFTKSLNESKLFAGIIIIILNVGGRFVPISLSKSTEQFLKTNVSRDIIVFAIAWMGTRDIFISLLLTGVFILLTDYLMNFDSKMCCIPLKYKPIPDLEIVSDEELNKAIQVLEASKKKKMFQEQHDSYHRLFKT
jgi:hypothetical protein